MPALDGFQRLRVGLSPGFQRAEPLEIVAVRGARFVACAGQNLYHGPDFGGRLDHEQKERLFSGVHLRRARPTTPAAYTRWPPECTGWERS